MTTVYHYDLFGNVILETDASGQTKRVYVYLNDTPLAQIDKSGSTETITYLHVDHLNTPRLGTDGSGTAVWNWEGEACGLTPPSGSVTVNLRFPGQYYDAESGLHYNWNRYYDPRLCRYITSDPIGLAGGLNTYAYVGNNPLYWTDPRGLQAATVPSGPISIPGKPTIPGLPGWATNPVGICVWLLTLTSPYDPHVAACDDNPGSCPIYNKPPDNAYDPNGPKAPGKPTEADGFKGPKDGDDWVPNPNGRGNGWRDADDNVWVPTGPRPGNAHGGPHWDVQNPQTGGHKNRYPGGKTR